MSFLRPPLLGLAAALAFGLSQVALPAVARAQTAAADNARVSELFKTGKQAFGHGDMAEAERLFGEAWSLRRSSDIAANLGQAELEQKKFRAAAEHFLWALSNLLPSASDAQRKAVEMGLSRARAEVGMLRLSVRPEGASVLVAEQDLGTAPVAQSVFVDPGEVIVSVKRAGYISLEQRVMVGKGTEQAVELALAPAPDRSPPAAAPAVASGLDETSGPPAVQQKKSLVPAYVASGVALAGGAVGLAFTLVAGSQEDDADALRDSLAPGVCSAAAVPSACTELKSQRESVDSSRNLALGAFIVGGVAALTAGYFYWDALSAKGSSARQPAPRFALLPRLELARPSPGRAWAAFNSAELSLSGNF